MKTSEFNFDLPEELIAQTPSKVRGDDRLLVMDKISGNIQHCVMSDFINFVDANTVMVFNNSKVRRARCFAKKLNSISEKPVEFMVLSCLTKNDFSSSCEKKSFWRCMVKNAKKQKVGFQYEFCDGTIGTIVDNPLDNGSEFRTLCFDTELTDLWFETNGHIPLPPYIKRQDNAEDSERYQNVYAKELGSSACPTAGLHFTENMLKLIAASGVQSEFITLHVGLGTFLPVRVENIEEHKMHEEIFTINADVAQRITEAKRCGKKILAVGTTSVRTLESAWDDKKSCLKSGTFSTNIFIYPGYKFKVIDNLFTNFHTPESTLMMLVSAFAGKQNIMNAYNEAITQKYRFFSYGDAMLIK